MRIYKLYCLQPIIYYKDPPGTIDVPSTTIIISRVSRVVFAVGFFDPRFAVSPKATDIKPMGRVSEANGTLGNVHDRTRVAEG